MGSVVPPGILGGGGRGEGGFSYPRCRVGVGEIMRSAGMEIMRQNDFYGRFETA